MVRTTVFSKLTGLAVVAALLAACGGGGAPPMDPDPVGPVVTACSLERLDSEIPTDLTVSGTGFAPIGGTATVRLVALEGTPFMGDRAEAIEIPATIDSATRLRASTNALGITGSIEARLELVLPEGGVVAAPEVVFRIDGPTILAVEPTTLLSRLPKDFVILGTGFGGSPSVRFTAQVGTPFQGGTSPTLDVPATVDSPTRLHGTTPPDIADLAVTTDLSVRFSSGAATPSPANLELSPAFRITGSTQVDGDAFGYAVAISGDTAVVGAPYQEEGWVGIHGGAVYVFVRTADGWEEQAQLFIEDYSDFEFGYSVDIDGDTLVVGDPAYGSGYVYLFERIGTEWHPGQPQLFLSGGNSPHARFGHSVALSGDTLVVGAPYNETPGAGEDSAAFVFVRSEGVWTRQTMLRVEDGAGDELFGYSVDIDGDRIIAGAPADHGDSGRAYVYTRTGTTWAERTLVPPQGVSDHEEFGHAVAISGETAIVGVPNHDPDGLPENAGAAHVFVLVDGYWREQATLVVPASEIGWGVGYAVALQGDTAVVGAPYATYTQVDQGGVYVFERTGTSWSQVTVLEAPDVMDYAEFGTSVDIDEGTVIVGAPYHYLQEAGVQSGAAYIY